MKQTLISASLVATIVTGANAASSIVEDFSSNTIGALVTTGTVSGAAAADYSGGNMTLPVGGDTQRSYIGTPDLDYHSVSFSAQVDVVITATGGANAFFGLGPGLVGGDGSGGGPAFGEPSTGPVLFGAFNADDRDGGQINTGDFNTGTTDNVSGTGGDTPVVGSGSHTLFLDWDANTQMLDISASINGGAQTALATLDGSDNGFTAADSRIFFGGDGSTIFDNFRVTVVPEPSTTLLAGFVGLFGLARRRR